MVTCYLRYVVDPAKLSQFERYARAWIRLVGTFGGVHHGYFMPSEGASNIALALFTFPSLAEYERYRQRSFADDECLALFAEAEREGFVASYERSFFRPVFDGA